MIQVVPALVIVMISLAYLRRTEFCRAWSRPSSAEPRGTAVGVSPRHLHMASLVEVDRPRRGWRQIDVTPAGKGTTIIDPHRHASIVADDDQRPKRKRSRLILRKVSGCNGD
jgi:hypothetical protein